MKILKILILLFVILLPGHLTAQMQPDYNRKGDEAMRRQDYRKATMWYEEGAMQCDSYSIEQLTTIWKLNKKMRSSMRGLMSKCFDCLRDKATIDNDTAAISQLILYYREGIGTLANEERARSWSNRLEELRKPVEVITYRPAKEKKPREPMKFFVGYAFSIEAPYGLTVGGVGKRFGWYARFRTNLSFDNYTNECRGDKDLVTIPDNAAYRFTNKKKSNHIAATAGWVIKCAPWLYTSVGLGYGKRELLYEYNTIPYSDSKNKESFWAKHTDQSYTGVVADLDFMVKFGSFFVSAGCNTLNFKYVDLNAGLGMFFLKDNKMKQLYYTLIISSFLFLFYSCLDEPDMDGGVQNARVPEVGVTEFREKTATTLLVSSSVIKENGLPLTKRGFRCWQIDPENEEKLLGVAKDTFDTKDIEKGEYSMLIEGLKNNACYKITALAFNEMGVGYSKDTIKVYTNQGIGAVKISEIEESQVTASTAKVEGIISDKGEGEILDFGFELYLNGKKDTTFRKSDGVDWGDTDSTFSYVLTGLKQMTDYEIVAFAENSFGSFSQNGKKKFCTKDGRPVLKDTISAKADFDFVSMFAELASQGESALEEVGFCWTTERNPLRPNLEEDESIVGELTAENTFCGQINALETNVTYYARAYAKNAFGVVYSKDSIRISRKRNVPTISLKPSSSFIIEDGIVTIGGELQDEGKADSSRVTLSLYYSTDEKDLSSSSEYPTKYEGVQDINLEEDGKTFNVSLKLLGGKQYYVRAYATNASGTAASKEIETFTLQDIFVAKESFPGDGRQDFMAFSLGDNAYVLGGKVGNDYTNQLYCYGSGSKAWTQLVSYEWNIEGGSVCTDGNSAYIIGGKEAENITEVYSYAYNEWKHRPSMKLRNDMVGTLNAISFVQNGSVVVIGGEKILANDSRGLIVQDSIYYWKDGDWNHANNFPAMIKGGIAVTEGDTVIVGLGSISTDSISGNSSVNRKLWYSSGGDWNQWTALTEAPTDMGKVSTGVVKDSCLYFIDDKSVIWMYSLNDNTWYKRSKWDSGVTDKPEYKILIIGETIHLLAINNFGVSSFVTYDPTWDIANEQNGF